MSRIHDVGGLHGFGPLADRARRAAVPPRVGGARLRNQPFSARAGRYTLDEFRAAIEQMPPAHYLAASYYERRLFAIEALIREKGVLGVRGR